MRLRDFYWGISDAAQLLGNFCLVYMVRSGSKYGKWFSGKKL